MPYVLLIAVAFAILRFIVPVEGKISHDDVFKDLAHLFVGGCFGAAILATVIARRLKAFMIEVKDFPAKEAFAIMGVYNRIAIITGRLWLVAIGLTVLEVVAFVLRAA